MAKKFFRKSFLPICLLLIFCLLLYAAWESVVMPLLQGTKIDIQLFCDNLLRLNKPFPYLLYMLMLVGAYVAVPKLRRFVKKKKNKNYISGGIIVLAAAAQSALQTAGVFNREMNFTAGEFAGNLLPEYAAGYVPYILVGCYLTAFLSGKKNCFAFIGTAAVLSIILVLHSGTDSVSGICDYMTEMNTLPTLVYGCGMFTVFDLLSGERETKKNAAGFMANTYFGVYIFHILVLDRLMALMPYKSFNEQNPILYLIVLYVIDFAVTFAVIFSLTKVRGVKKLFRA